MADVIDMASRRDAEASAAFEAYRVAALRAQTTLASQDGIAAGKAWRAFLDLYLTNEQREALGQADAVIRGRVFGRPQSVHSRG